MKTITAARLEQLGACEPAVEDFRRVFGESCEASARNAAIWMENFEDVAQEDFEWLLWRLFGRSGRMSARTIRIARRLEAHLGIERGVVLHIGDIIQELLHMDDGRIAKAMEEIIDRLPNL